jgi:predicted GNAT superfamily acetyltransferase
MGSSQSVSPHSDIVIRNLESRDDIEQCVSLQRATWGDGFREHVPPAMIRIVQKVGGIALGAFDARQLLVGFVFGLTGMYEGRLAHWSHMLAVRTDMRDHGIGRRLKEAQRARLLALGVERALWTFDPLVARNAHLNLVRLGARAIEYVPDMYDPDPMSTTDSVIGTDRFVVELATSEPAPPSGMPLRIGSEVPRLLSAGDCARPTALPSGRTVAVGIPTDIQALKDRDPALAAQWRFATRQVLQHYLGHGYHVRGVASLPGPAVGCCYVLEAGHA